MIAEERQSTISKMLDEKGGVSTQELVSLFGVSDETVRRDLIKLEKKGLCVKVHSGAVRAGEFVLPSVISGRMTKNERAKAELAHKVIEFVDNGDIIGIDAGSTAVAFARELEKNFENLTVITYSLDVFEILKNKFKIILCGGEYSTDENAFYGEVAHSIVSDLHTQKVFLAPSAISLNSGVRDYSGDLIIIQREMYKNSDNVFFIADSSKFEKQALYKLAPIDGEHVFITDDKLPEDIKAKYTENNIKIY